MRRGGVCGRGTLKRKNKPTHSTHVALRKSGFACLTQLTDSKRHPRDSGAGWFRVSGVRLSHGAVRRLAGMQAPERTTARQKRASPRNRHEAVSYTVEEARAEPKERAAMYCAACDWPPSEPLTRSEAQGSPGRSAQPSPGSAQLVCKASAVEQPLAPRKNRVRGRLRDDLDLPLPAATPPATKRARPWLCDGWRSLWPRWSRMRVSRFEWTPAKSPRRSAH